MRAVPIELAATGATGELAAAGKGLRRDFAATCFLVNNFKQRITHHAARKGVALAIEIEPSNDRRELAKRIFVFETEDFDGGKAMGQSRIARQNDSPFALRQRGELAILNRGKMKRIVAQQTQPPRQLARMIIGDETDHDIVWARAILS